MIQVLQKRGTLLIEPIWELHTKQQKKLFRIFGLILSLFIVYGYLSFIDDQAYLSYFKSVVDISSVIKPTKYRSFKKIQIPLGKIYFDEIKLNFNVPFYVYDKLDWMSILCNGKGVENYLDSAWMKHSDDYWFLKHALEHPLRTKVPENASLFVVGALQNLIVENKIFWSRMNCCVGSVCKLDLIQKIDEMLMNSTWFHRSEGRDHIFVGSHYGSKGTLHKYKAILNCSWISFENNNPTENGRVRIASTYVGRKCEPQKKQYDIAFIASMHPERITFKSRRDACDWLSHQNSARKWSVAHCGNGKQCPALAQARMGLHIRVNIRETRGDPTD